MVVVDVVGVVVVGAMMLLRVVAEGWRRPDGVQLGHEFV